MRFSEYQNISLQYHSILNPLLWNNETLFPEVRNKLLEIAKAWQEWVKIDNEILKDVIMTGGNANYNYTSQSDIDIHLVIDYNQLSNNPTFIRDFFMDKKALWSVNHSSIRVKGYPVELFAQPLDEKYHQGQGVYSVLFDKWIVKPTNEKLDFANNSLLKHKVEYYEKRIDDLIDSNTTDEAVLFELKSKIKNMRGAAIEKAGEFSIENLVFKELRNDGYLDRLSKYLRAIEDKTLSLESQRFSEFLLNERVSGETITLYHGTHKTNLDSVLQAGLEKSKKGYTAGQVSLAVRPDVAFGYAAMSGVGGERAFRDAGTHATHTNAEDRVTFKFEIPKEWIDKNLKRIGSADSIYREYIVQNNVPKKFITKVYKGTEIKQEYGNIKESEENHHCFKKICSGCGNTITCRCRTPKTEVIHVQHCQNCEEE